MGHNYKKVFISSYLILFSIFIFPGIAFSQVLLAPGEQTTQNFDDIGTAPSAALPLGWKVDRLATLRTVGAYNPAGNNTTARAGNNMAFNASHGIYNFGAGPASTAIDRAVGFLATGGGTASGNLYVSIRNDGTSAINSLVLSYDVEKYRRGTNPAGFSITLYYSKNGTTWTSAGPEFVVSFPPDPDRMGYPNAPGEVKSISNKTLILSGTNAVAPNELIYLAWNYSLSPGTGTVTTNSQALGVDNIVINAPAPSNNTITKPVVAGAPFTLESCEATANGTAAFLSVGLFGTNNQYVVQLSNSTGNFSNAVTIGSGPQSAVPFTIPARTPAGTGYRIRVYSTNPFAVSEPSDPFTINAPAHRCVSASNDFYRSRQNGDWHSASTWESSADNITWIPATLYPDYLSRGITILPGHTVNIGADLTVDQLVVEVGAQLIRVGGNLEVNNVGGHDIIIRGSYAFEGGSGTTYEEGSSIWVESGGIVEVRNNQLLEGSATGSPLPVHHGTSENYFYQTGAIFSWNVPGSGTMTSSIYNVFFPNSQATASNIPVLRILGTPAIGSGATPIVVNGLTQIEPNSTLTFQGSGTKTLRNGLAGEGTTTQVANSGKLLITGATAQLGGGGIINLGNAGMDIVNNSQVQLLNDKTVNATGGAISVVSGVLNTATFSLQGTAGFNISAQGVLQTAHPDGVGGSITLSGNRIFSPSGSYVFSTSIDQSTNFPVEVTGVKDLTINNTGRGMTILNKSLPVSGQVTVSGIFDADTFSLSGPGSFVLNADGTLRTSHEAGVAGSIQVVNQLFNPAASYRFAGGLEQSTGLPEQISTVGELVVEKANGGVLTLNKSLTVSRGVNVTGIMSLQNFILSGAGNFSLINGSTLLTANEGGIVESIQLQGIQIYSPTASYGFNGVADQTTGFPESVGTAERLIINNSGGNVSLNKPFGVSVGLDLTSGNLLTTEENIVTLGPGSTVSNASDTSFVAGPMVKVGSEAFTFPVGKDTVYAPIGMTSPGSESSIFRAEYFPTPAPNNERLEETLVKISQVEYWVINKLSEEEMGENVQVTLYWNDGQRSGIRNPLDLRVAHYNEELNIWEDMGNGQVTGSAEAGSITSSRSFLENGPITFGAPDETNPLPVTFISFTGKYKHNAALLEWSTATEVNNLGFEVEKSTDGESFYRIGFVEGSGNSTVQKSYSFTDHDFQYEAYYRLKQLDVDGQYAYSEVVYVRQQNLGGLAFQLYPNPASEQVALISECCSNNAQEISLKIVGSDGRIVGTTSGNLKSINLYLNKQLATYPRGLYHLYIQTATSSEVLKLVKN